MTPSDEIMRIVSAQLKHVADEVAKVVAERIAEAEAEEHLARYQEDAWEVEQREREAAQDERERQQLEREKLQAMYQ